MTSQLHAAADEPRDHSTERSSNTARGPRLSVRDVSSTHLVARHTLYFYVDGSDLHEVAPTILREVERLVDSRTWSQPAWIVNHVYPRDVSMRPDDLTDWDLGLNYELPDLTEVAGEWLGDVERIAAQIDQVAFETGRGFVMGLGNNETGISEDILHLRGGGVDLDRLRAMLGASPPAGEAR
jgi:hypothetical protein